MCIDDNTGEILIMMTETLMVIIAKKTKISFALDDNDNAGEILTMMKYRWEAIPTTCTEWFSMSPLLDISREPRSAIN